MRSGRCRSPTVAHDLHTPRDHLTWSGRLLERRDRARARERRIPEQDVERDTGCVAELRGDAAICCQRGASALSLRGRSGSQQPFAVGAERRTRLDAKARMCGTASRKLTK